jgi:hypothetical protein
VTTLVGSGEEEAVNGVGIHASFRALQGICVDTTGNVYVTDKHSVRKIQPNGI